MSAKLRAAIIGFGKIGSGYAKDPLMARHYQFATHAQVLAAHPAYAWTAVVDPSADARATARNEWSVPHAAATVAELGQAAREIEVAVLGTPPETRLELLEDLPALRAVLVEKPLGRSLAESAAFLQRCAERGVLVQVNLWRRSDERFRSLAAGQLTERIGTPWWGFGVYGNGVLNNGTHLVDFVRMQLGEVESVTPMGPAEPFVAGPIAGDVNPSFALNLRSGVCVAFHPAKFAAYRENGVDFWGDRGRIAIYNEGLTIATYSVAGNRAMTGEQELVQDAPEYLEPTVGAAFYHMFTNLASALEKEDSLWSPGDSALRTSAVVEAIIVAARERRTVRIDEIHETRVTRS